jgi:hypothetical protein
METTTKGVEMQSGEKFFEGDHTEWTFVKRTEDGFLFRAQDGFEHIFESDDLAVLSRTKGAEASAF